MRPATSGRDFSPEEFDRIYAALPEYLRDFTLLGYVTGWRRGEIASTTWGDIDDGVIRLRGENAKNGEACSTVIAGELVALIERRRQARLVNGVLTDRVFHRDGGTVIKNFRRAWPAACLPAGVTGRLFRDLRRTGVRNMIRSGVPQNVAMKISGHKTDSVFRRYDICNEDDLKAARESVARHREAEASKVVSIWKTRTKGGQSASKQCKWESQKRT